MRGYCWREGLSSKVQVNANCCLNQLSRHKHIRITSDQTKLFKTKLLDEIPKLEGIVEGGTVLEHAKLSSEKGTEQRD